MKRITLIIAVCCLMLAACGGRDEATKQETDNGQQSARGSQQEAQPEWVDSVTVICMKDSSRNPIEVLENLMSQPFCHMHGPEHHVLVGAALLTAYNNCLPDSTKIDMSSALAEVIERGQQVPGGACGYMGACGASISAGIFMSVVTRNTPFSSDTWRLCNLCTARALEQVAENGGPRCCKRDSYLSILATVDFVDKYLGVKMEKTDIRCSRSQINEQCIGKKCPFSPAQ